MKKIILSILIFFVPFLVSANSISKINMNIYVDNNGDAIVTESWQANTNSGTEGYHPYFNIGNSNIELISASMDGKEFTIKDSWDVDASFSEKAYSAGIYIDGTELDICYGITEYGSHTYVIKYKISNFVAKLSDADMIYWTLFPQDFSVTPNNIYIKIYSDFRYSDTLDVWGYGNLGGYAYVYDGYIEMSSSENYSSSDYMTILVKFPSGTFTTNNNLNNEFDYYYNMANEGSTAYQSKTQEKKSMLSLALDFIIWLVSIILRFIIPIGIIVFALGKAKREYYDYGTTGNTISKDTPNFRDIPCNKDLYRAYYISTKYNLNKKKEDFLGAIILSWIKKGAVKVEKVETKKLLKTEVLDNIIFVNNPHTNNLEDKLYNWMYTASVDGKLEANEFKTWCSSNYKDILKWFDDVIEYEQNILINEKKITVETSNKKLFNKTVYHVDASLMDEAKQLYGLKNFLKEFSLINEKEPIEVTLWDEYLIFAQMFGMAKEVASQFKKLYPEITEQMDSMGLDYNYIIFIDHISSQGMSSAQSRANSYSSGGGGFSSGGGGGGSFGGGGGGGGFR